MTEPIIATDDGAVRVLTLARADEYNTINPALRDALAGYLGHARKVTASRGRKTRATTSGPSARELRDWARSNGFEVSDRGRVPAEVRDAFEAAH